MSCAVLRLASNAAGWTKSFHLVLGQGSSYTWIAKGLKAFEDPVLSQMDLLIVQEKECHRATRFVIHSSSGERPKLMKVFKEAMDDGSPAFSCNKILFTLARN